jgi:hypothetical protein
VPSGRLAFALRQLESGDWLLFEQFAAEFLAVEFPSLRTTASSSGDKGRDGELFVLNDVPKTAFQYSVARDWKTKIKRTRNRLQETMPGITRLAYVTNQLIGPDSDELVEEFRKGGIALDIRDRNWFVDRELTFPQRAAAAEELAERIVAPLLGREGVSRSVGVELTNDDARVALLHLALEGYDALSNRNLTKSSFEALVLSSLHESSAEHSKTSAEIHDDIKKFVPADNPAQVQAHVNGALTRLSVKGGPIKFVSKEGTYHLAFDRQAEAAERTVRFLAGQQKLEDELAFALEDVNVTDSPIVVAELAETLRVGIEEVLFKLGEASPVGFARETSSSW